MEKSRKTRCFTGLFHFILRGYLLPLRHLLVFNCLCNIAQLPISD